MKPLLNLITDRRALRLKADWPDYEPQLERIREAAAAGVDFIQVREPDLSARRLEEFVRAVLEVTALFPTKVLINDRLDIAMAAGAAGVHLKVRSISPSDVRTVTSNKFIIGASTHSLAEARTAAGAGADFIVAGPVFETPSKQSYGPPLGLERLEEICLGVAVPVLAIGGITLENYRQTLKSGARGIAAIRLFQEDITARIRSLSEISADDGPS